MSAPPQFNTQRHEPLVQPSSWWRSWLPSRGNVLFVLLVLGGLLWAGKAGAFPLNAPAVASDSTTTISYQGRLSDSTGAPVTSSGIPMQFRLYSTNVAGSPLWSETQASVPVEAGVFHALLGSTTPIPVSLLASNTSLWLGMTVGSDSEMTPREQVASVPYAMVASSVADGSITTSKMADGSVTKVKLGADVSFVPPDGSVTTSKIADGAVTQSKAPMLIASENPGVRIYYWASCSVGSSGYLVQWPIPFARGVSVVASPWQGEGMAQATMATASNFPGLQDMQRGAVIHIFDRNGTEVGGCVKVIAIGS